MRRLGRLLAISRCRHSKLRLANEYQQKTAIGKREGKPTRTGVEVFAVSAVGSRGLTASAAPVGGALFLRLAASWYHSWMRGMALKGNWTFWFGKKILVNKSMASLSLNKLITLIVQLVMRRNCKEILDNPTWQMENMIRCLVRVLRLLNKFEVLEDRSQVGHRWGQRQCIIHTPLTNQT